MYFTSRKNRLAAEKITASPVVKSISVPTISGSQRS